MEKLTILVDMDNCIENLSVAWVGYLNDRYGTDVPLSNVTSWDISKAFPSLSKEQVYGVLQEKALWERVKPLPGAAKYLKRIMDDGNDVFIVTASHPDTVGVKMNTVLFKYFPFIPYENIIVSRKKQMISGDILIDDGIHNLGGNYMGMLFTANHNKSVTDEELMKLNAVRVDNWKEVYELVHGYQRNHKAGGSQ